MRAQILSRLFITLTALLASAAGIASEKDGVIEKRVAVETPVQFSDVAAQVRAEMRPGGRYEFIRPAEKAKVDGDIDAIGAMLQQAGSVSAMSENEKVKLFNTQEHLNGILTHSDSNRLVCERRAPMGTNIPVTSCKTVGEVEKMRRDSEKYMTDHSRDANINKAAILARDLGH